MTIRILSSAEIKKIIDTSTVAELIQCIENGFVLYSQKKVIVPPVGHLSFASPPGDVHIKFGYIQHDDSYVIKVASGFYQNHVVGISSSNGLMLIFSQQTGTLVSILLDEGYLTDLRTALAGAVVAKYLAPSQVRTIGIVGTGIQARLQLQLLRTISPCREVIVWGRNTTTLESFTLDSALEDFTIKATTEIADITENCNLIVTTTPSNSPLLFGQNIKAGTHITAVGADAAGKQELDISIFANADMIVADSIDQCINHGDLFYALKSDAILPSKIMELGDLIQNGVTRKNDSQITVADLTGVAVQDIQIANFVYRKSVTVNSLQ